MKRNGNTKATTDAVTYRFTDSTSAWAFMRGCDAVNIAAGFPGLLDYTVQVAVHTWQDRETTDALANGAPVVGYAFGKPVSA